MAAETKKKKGIDITVWLLISMIAAVVVGLVVGEPMKNVQFIGDIFFRLIQMTIPIFILCTIVKSVGGLTPQTLSGIGLKGIIVFIVTTGIAAAIGVSLGVTLQPGSGLENSSIVANASFDGEATAMMSIQDTITGFFGNNIVASLSNGSMIQIIIFAVAFGLVISFWRHSHDGECMAYDLCCEVSDLLLNIIRAVMKIAPIGIFCYVSAMIGTLGMDILLPLGKYFLVMLLGMAIMFAIYFIVVPIYCRVSPFKLMKKMLRMTVTAFTTISSAITLPTAMEDAKNRIGIREDIVDVLLPLGVPLNSNGVAIHMAVDALCIAQMYGVHFGPNELLTVWVICTMIAFVNAATPGASLVSLTMMVPALNLPMAAIGIFGGLEYPTGASRTPLNVDGDVFAAMLVAGPDGIDHEIFDTTD
ncbi:dicarboxylate/amino acid:cation symporter [Collinsella sp. TM05-38]|jgi:proton glutamate symport protein|uniref:dicarboxylate/amino acid:cation symporter n=1 Tax=Collinsella sp. TM05-38 TaxID=2292341 RepID=UPI000E4B5021|nr:dicarboxylate/amino acid:cation symporter [Collinsella sp. TM05-38]RGJ69321.1 dicarboxylate/amino acid:cation symporter [Collinsella sp. TM05-38]